MTQYNGRQPTMNGDGYLELKRDVRLTVDWKGAVILFSSRVAWYGFVLGLGIGIMASFWNGKPLDWFRTLSLITGTGLSMSGIMATVAIFYQDIRYPRQQPRETTRSLPAMGAPGNMKPQALQGTINGSIKIGRYKMQPQQQLALCNAVIRNGETLISQRKLAEWGVVSTKESNDGKQLKADFIFTGLGEEAPNEQVRVTDTFYQWAGGLFPELLPHPRN